MTNIKFYWNSEREEERERVEKTHTLEIKSKQSAYTTFIEFILLYYL